MSVFIHFVHLRPVYFLADLLEITVCYFNLVKRMGNKLRSDKKNIFNKQKLGYFTFIMKYVA